MKMDKY